MDRSVILYCRHCQTGFAAIGKIPSTCPKCQKSAEWTTSLEPRVPFVLHYNDRILLKALRIGAE